MGNLIFWAVMIVLFLAVTCKEMWDNHAVKRRFQDKLCKEHGHSPDKKYTPRRWSRVSGYYEKHPKEGQIDDITWSDLSMDEVFKRMNYSYSSAGEEYLYYTLRTPQAREDVLLQREAMVDYFAQNENARVEAALILHKLGSCGEFSLYDYLDHLNDLEDRCGIKQIAINLVILGMIPMCFLNVSLGLFVIVALMVWNIVTYFKEKKEIQPYVISFSFVMRLLNASRDLVKLQIPPCEETWATMRLQERKLSVIRRGYGWILSGTSTFTGGSPLDILKDYLNMAFHVDVLLFYRLLRQVRIHIGAIDELVTCVGSVETALCIEQYRASLSGVWCRPTLTRLTNEEMHGTASGDSEVTEEKNTCRKRFCMENGYHPLVESPVVNTICTEKCVLLTGSNASGKSTFLKTAAINAVFAQTIYTCLAQSYEAPFYRIYSSMALRDSISAGESYFIVEIKSLKRILDASKSTEAAEFPVLCFVDEVLRGTNTIERVAAATQILKRLAKGKVLCFAATHDMELTESLQEEYDNYHFEEEILEGDVRFSYQLLPGKATGRNAIRLLSLMGFDEEIITRAMEHAMELSEEKGIGT